MPPRCARESPRGLQDDPGALPSRPPKALQERAKKASRRPRNGPRGPESPKYCSTTPMLVSRPP
eukprot:4895233-Pyramimonas_sp.AAC.1